MHRSAVASTAVASNVVDICVVQRPPTWRQEPVTLSYVLVGDEPNGGELAATYRWALDAALERPRVISPLVLRWSSLFHPRFSVAMRAAAAPIQVPELRFEDDDGLGDLTARTRFWLESVLFLAAVTLSAAIVQSRWSAGTVASKYDRLWQAAAVADDASLPEIASLDLRAAVTELVRRPDLPPLDRLLLLRRMFEQTVARLGGDVPAEAVTMETAPLPASLADRFGFVDDLRDGVGRDLQSVIAYGSSISSEDFADYDLVLVSLFPESTLRRLADTSPSWRGKELNVGVYSPDELWCMQRLSGDNLAEYGLCIFGAAELPTKPRGVLLARNLSFGVVRQRQQLGMIGPALENEAVPGDDRRNLYEYFVKIPANVAKGTFGAAGRRLPKELVQEWLRDRCGFDAPAEQRRATDGKPGEALAEAAVATGAALEALNEEFRLVTPVTASARVGREGTLCRGG